MKSLQHTLFVLLLILLTSCGEDRTGEFYALIEDRMWIEEVMRENYLWAEDMPVIEKEDDYFQEPFTEGFTLYAQTFPLKQVGESFN